MELPRFRKKAYRYSLLALLGATDVVNRADYHLPSKWHSFFEGIRASTGVIHGVLSSVDEEVEEEYRRKELMLEKRFGDEKFYDPEEIEELKESYSDVEV